MYLKRSLIKSQAKQLIKGNVFKLFVITLIVSLCVSFVSGVVSVISNYNIISTWSELFRAFSRGEDIEDYMEDYFNDYFSEYFGDDFNEYYNGSGDSDYFNGFGDDGWDFNNFSGEISLIPANNQAEAAAYNGFTISFFSYFSYLPFIITALLTPIAITLAGLYVSFIRGRKFEFEDGIKTVFVDAFKVNYLKKVGVYVFRMIVMGLLMLLLLVPGIIFAYSSYFAYQIMCDYPGLTAWEAIKLSKKIVKGNRFELFLMNLSFLPWAFLCIFVFPVIYFVPYFETTNALYYENFRLRAIQQGRVTEDDFLSAAQRCAKYGAMDNNQYYSPNTAQQGTYHDAPQQPQQGQQYANYDYSNPYQPYGTTANQQYQPAADQPYGTTVNQQYNPAPNTPPAQPQTPPVEPQQAPQETAYEAPKPAEPENYPWEGK
ncbi:MAG: DUF975 family protein [Eubacterium sp.]|nr:DUF975 family protein [Eubacterium sp.]